MARNTGVKVYKPADILALKRLGSRFYGHKDVVFIARQLLGKILVTNISNIITAARIVETEAYNGIVDKASHAFGDRRTNRTEVMYGEGGVAYVYLCYGIHHLFNIVTNKVGVAHAVLVRGAEPLVGVEDMLIRTGKTKLDASLTRGPGNVSKALGIATLHTGTHLGGNNIYLADDGFKYPEDEIGVSPRIGVDYAAEDALLPYRFYVRGNQYVSGKINK